MGMFLNLRRARSAWFTRQNIFEFFHCWFLQRHPWHKNGTLKFVSPCAYMTAVHIWFQALFRPAFGRAVQKESGRFSSTKSNCVARYFEKAKTSVTIEGRNKVIPCTALTCFKAATIRPAASCSGLYKSSTLKRGMDASPFEASVPGELRNYNFRVTRVTCTYILHEIGDEIFRQDTPMRKAVTLNRRLAIALFYLDSSDW